MKTSIAILALIAALIVPSVYAAADKPGALPKDYRALIAKKMNAQLKDAGSAKVEYVGSPRLMDFPIVTKNAIRGYGVCMNVNAKNSFGAYTGVTRAGAFIVYGMVFDIFYANGTDTDRQIVDGLCKRE
jgi:hypothetical protein